jgi:hypothetical protein
MSTRRPTLSCVQLELCLFPSRHYMFVYRRRLPGQGLFFGTTLPRTPSAALSSRSPPDCETVYHHPCDDTISQCFHAHDLIFLLFSRALKVLFPTTYDTVIYSSLSGSRPHCSLSGDPLPVHQIHGFVDCSWSSTQIASRWTLHWMCLFETWLTIVKATLLWWRKELKPVAPIDSSVRRHFNHHLQQTKSTTASLTSGFMET